MVQGGEQGCDLVASPNFNAQRTLADGRQKFLGVERNAVLQTEAQPFEPGRSQNGGVHPAFQLAAQTGFHIAPQDFDPQVGAQVQEQGLTA